MTRENSRRRRKARVYFRLTIAFTLIFALIATGVISALWFSGNLSLPGTGKNSVMQSSYVNALLLGVDADGYRTDTIMLAQFNLLDNTIHVLQIPRDTYVDIGKVDKKINSAYGYNKEKQLFKEVEYVLPGVNVDKYIMIDTKGFREVIDAIGGVEMNVPINMYYNDPVQNFHINLKKGTQVLDGKKAEQFVRFRQNDDGTGYPNGDTDRVKAQTEFMNAAIDKVMSIKTVFQIPKLISIVTDNVKTNFSAKEIAKYAPMALKVNPADIVFLQLEGEGQYLPSPFGYKLSYFVPYKEKTKQIIAEHFTPSADEVNAQEIAIRDKLIGDSSQEMKVGEEPILKEGFFNRFTKVDILDGSDGTANVDAIIQKIEAQGYRVTDVNSTNGVVYPTSKIIGKKDNGHPATITAVIGATSYLINPSKTGNTAVTVIVGKDMASKE
ncbi:MAG: LytR family transcriptional regulator [Ruminococcaceae bacterium]|nr:LytR family transcriptional regulator [Oscillospiraceae bacterium]